MGKSNRVRAQRASSKLVAPVKIKTKQKTGMPLWLKTFIAAAVAVIVLAVCVLGILSSNGVIMRYRAAVKSEHFTVSGNMMAYYYQTQYQSFQSQYSSYLSYFSLDTSKSLKEQTFGDASGGNAYETSFLGEFDGTWFDYFMNAATNQAEQLLIYCEEAYARDIELDDEELAEIDESLEMLKTTAASSGYTANTYIAGVYGQGVNLNDIKKAMKLSALAEKCALELEAEILDGISDGDIQSKYNESKKDFNIIDYSYYTLDVSYDEIVEEVLGSDYTEVELKDEANSKKVLDEYKHHIDEAKAVAEKLKACKTEAEFNKVIYEHLAEKYYDEKVEKLSLSDEKLFPGDTVKATIKTELIKAVVADIIADLDTTAKDTVAKDDKYTLYSQEVSKEYAEAIDGIKSSVFSSILSDKEKYILEKQTYTAEDEFSEWAFADGRKAGDIKTILEGDGAEGEVTDEEGSFSATVYLLTTPQRPDEALTKDVIYMVFSDKDLAAEAIEKFKAGELTVEAFEEISHELGADTHKDYEDYVEGSLGADAFDKWLFADSTAKGTYTTEPIAADDSSYIVAFYYDDGMPTWKVSVESSIFSDRFEAKFNEMEAAYTITVKDKVLSKIDG